MHGPASLLRQVAGNQEKAVEILGITGKALKIKLKIYKDAGLIE